MDTTTYINDSLEQQTPKIISDEERQRMDEWDAKRKYIFDDKEEYIHFCQYVDRYVDMHGIRGVKDRNDKYLRQLQQAKTTREEDTLLWNLVENNRPLAMREAMIQYSYSDWSMEDVKDAFEDAVLNLAQTYRRRLDDIKTMDIEQFQQLNFYTCKNAVRQFNDSLQRFNLNAVTGKSCYDEQDEDTFERRERWLNVDVPNFNEIIKILTVREQEILKCIVFGDQSQGITSDLLDPFALERISEILGVTYKRGLQLRQKIFKKLRKADKYYKVRERIFSVDDEYSFNIEKHNMFLRSNCDYSQEEDIAKEFFAYLKNKQN